MDSQSINKIAVNFEDFANAGKSIKIPSADAPSRNACTTLASDTRVSRT